MISPCHQTPSGINRLMPSLYDLKSRKFHLVIHQRVTIHCHPFMVHVIGPKAIYFLVVQNKSKLLKRKKKNLKINILVDWLNVKRLYCRHSKIVKRPDQTEHTLWGSPRWDFQNNRMRFHELSHLSKKQSICVSHKKKKKSNQIKITKIRKNVINIVQFPLHYIYCILR